VFRFSGKREVSLREGRGGEGLEREKGLGSEKRRTEGEGGRRESVRGRGMSVECRVSSVECRELENQGTGKKQDKEGGIVKDRGPTYAGFSESAMSSASRSSWLASYIAEKASTSS